MSPWVVASVCFSVILAVAAWCDLRSRKIPNLLVLVGLAVGLGVRLGGGLGGVREGVLGAALACVVGLTLFAIGAVGGGDGKLLIVVGMFMGPTALWPALAAIAVAGGIAGLAAAIYGGRLLPVLASTGELLRYLLSFGRSGARPPRAVPMGGLPYAVPIAIGALGVWFIGGMVS